MKSASYRRSRRIRRLIAVAATFLVGLFGSASAPAQCHRCQNDGAVVVSLSPEILADFDVPGLDQVPVEFADAGCPNCGTHSNVRTHTGALDESRWCDAFPGQPSVREELIERRQSQLSGCRGLHPRLQLRAGAVYMDRVTEDFFPLIESTSSPINQLNTEAFHFDWQPGLDVSASLLCWDSNQFELRFLGLREFTANQRVEIGGSEVRINADPPIFAPNVDSIDSRYLSELYGFELNWHYVTYCPFNYIAGFRYVAFDEDLAAVMDAAPGSYAYRTSTENDLYGLQLGIESSPELPLFGWRCLSWFAKAGIFGNAAKQRTVLDTGLIGQVVSESPDTASALWEFGVGWDVPLSDCFTVQAGYSALILQRICIAGDQLRRVDFLDAVGSDNRGTAMFHGATVALVYRH